VLSRRWKLAFLAPLAFILAVFLIGPALFGLAASFTNYEPFQKINLQFVGIENYSRVIQDSDFQASVRNVAILTIGSVLAELSLGVAIAYALREPFRGRNLLRLVLLIPWLVSPVANGVMWHFIFDTEKGIVNYWPALLGLPRPPSPLSSGLALITMIGVEVWRTTPLVSFLVLPGLLGIPRAQWDQADIEGLPFILRIRHIVVPRLRLLLLTITLLLVGNALGTSESVLILTGGGPGSETITPGLYSYRQATQAFDWQAGATSAWLIAGAILIVGALYVTQFQREANR